MALSDNYNRYLIGLLLSETEVGLRDEHCILQDIIRNTYHESNCDKCEYAREKVYCIKRFKIGIE